MKKKVVIVGFPGIGMTELSKRRKEFIEIDFSNGGTISDAESLLETGHSLLVPFTDLNCFILDEASIDYTLVYPSRNNRDSIVRRMSLWPDDPLRASRVKDNWDSMIDKAMVHKCYSRILFQHDTSYLSDYADYISNLFKVLK